MSDDPLRDLWLDHEEDEMTIDVMDLRRQHATLERQVTRRNQLELFAGGLVVAAFGARALTASTTLEAAGSWLVVGGALLISWVIATRGQPLPAEPASDTRTFLDQRRAELEHQASLLEQVPGWYLAPLAPGMIVLTLDAYPGVVDPTRLAGWAASVAVLIALNLGIWWLNHRAARALRDEQAALPDPGA